MELPLEIPNRQHTIKAILYVIQLDNKRVDIPAWMLSTAVLTIHHRQPPSHSQSLPSRQRPEIITCAAL